MEGDAIIRGIKKSIESGKSREQITQRLLKKGYKLEEINSWYEEAAPKPPMLTTTSLLLIVLFCSLFLYVIQNFFSIPGDELKPEIKNPLRDLEETLKQQVIDQLQSSEPSEDNNASTGFKPFNEITVTPEFISFLLSEIGVWKLRPNPITRKEPIINTVIDGKSFHSTISESIITTNIGPSNNPDITISSTNRIILSAILSEDPKTTFEESFRSEESLVFVNVSEGALFAKGYFALRESIQL